MNQTIPYHYSDEVTKEYELLDTINDALEGIATTYQLRIPEILFITSYPPRECGIATYSQDLIHALQQQFTNSFACQICALESDSNQPVYPEPPLYTLNTDDRNAFVKTAFRINKNNAIELVVIQHEFGFYANKENEFLQLLQLLTKPVIIVFHTVLPYPDPALLKNVRSISTNATSIVVMTQNAALVLAKDYGISSWKITVIPHGTHLVPPVDQNQLKEQYHLQYRKVLSTFGLLSSSKNIETTLNALPAIVLRHPDVVFLVLGKTHPAIVQQSGESYREMLHQKVALLNLEEHVQFVNDYLPLQMLLDYLQLTDIYLFTSKDPNQAVSGTFSYAVSCGCPIVSTPIPHAREVLNNNNGIIIDFENPEQLATAVNSLLDQQKVRELIQFNSFMKMAPTAWQNSALRHALLFEEMASTPICLNYRIPELNLDHIRRMTSHIGFTQFAKIAIPDFGSGYTLDDNARALIAMGQHYELFREKQDLELIQVYLKFIQKCLQPNGLFLNYVLESNTFSKQNDMENLEDSNGRAIWALGYLVSLGQLLPKALITTASIILKSAKRNAANIFSPRAMAFIIKGLYYENKEENQSLIILLANRLVQMYRHERRDDWRWFESYMTYGNSVLPEALICAYLRTDHPAYRKIAVESFYFLLSKIINNGMIRVISNKGWLVKDETTLVPIGGEQPIDVAYTIVALERFFTVFGHNCYKYYAMIAFDWFQGRNHLHQIMYNPCTGGCYDGLEEYNINLNQGAESTISYLMARLAIERMRSMKTENQFTQLSLMVS